MTCWLYQMNAKMYSHERYRAEVWEGNIVTNWTGGEATRRPKPEEVLSGDLVILFFAKAGAVDPGIYGWGTVTFFDKEAINFRPASPSDYLKMNPLWDDETSDLINKIRGGMAQGTMWKVDAETLKQLRQKIATHIHAIP